MKKSVFYKIDGLVIFLVFILFRLKDLGIDIINSDAFWWKTRTYNFGNAISSFDFAGTAQTYHPGVTLLWINYVAVKIFSILNKFLFLNTLSERELFFVNHIIQKSFLVVILAILVTIIYIQLKKLFGTRFSIIFFILLTFTPFFVALTRVLHTDAILTLTMFLSFLSLLNYYKTFKKINLILSGFWLGLAVLTKSNSLIFIPFVLFVIIFEKLITTNNSHPKFILESILSAISNFTSAIPKSTSAISNFTSVTPKSTSAIPKSTFVIPNLIGNPAKSPKPILQPILLLFSTTIITFIAFWPAMWVAPIQTLTKYLFGITEVGVSNGHIHYFMDQFTSNPGVLYYPLALLARVDEILMILFLLGVVWYLKYKSKLKNRYVFYSLTFIVFYILVLSFPSKKLDRYILPTFPYIVFIATFFVTSISKKLKIKLKLIVPILLLNLLITDIHFYPDYMAYYSQLIKGPNVGRKYIDPTWPIGYASLSKYFNNIENSENISVAVHDEYSFRPFFVGKTINIENENEVKNATYVVTYTFMPEKINLSNFTKQSVFKVAGVDYYNIYINSNAIKNKQTN